MADITRRIPDCDDDCEGERGKRGKRGPRGDDGQDGATGETGATGPAGYNNFVFRPGGVEAQNVYTDWANLVAAASAVQGYKTIQFDDTIVSPAVIPGGAWLMTNVEWVSFSKQPSVANPNTVVNIGDGINAANDATFQNLLKISGDLLIFNRNVTTAPITLPVNATPNAATIFELGAGPWGDFPQIVEVGPAPFIDASAQIAGQQLNMRMLGSIAGAAAGSPVAIQLGASPGQVTLSLLSPSRIAARMVGGTNPAGILAVSQDAEGVLFAQQSNSFAGQILFPAVNQLIPYTRIPVLPSDGTSATAPLPVAFSALTPFLFLNQHNILAKFNASGGAIAQTLPKIKNAAPNANSFNAADGTLSSTGMPYLVKNTGAANNVTVTPAAGDTIDGLAAAVAVTPGLCLFLISDGVSNWTKVSLN